MTFLFARVTLLLLSFAAIYLAHKFDTEENDKIGALLLFTCNFIACLALVMAARLDTNICLIIIDLLIASCWMALGILNLLF